MAITQTRTIDTSELFDGPRQTRRPNVRGRRGAISAGHHLAALAGQRILDKGGNAIDAGVTAGICIGILLPDLVNVGGVAPIILHHVKSGDTQTISGVGRWPKAATVDSVRDPKTGNMARDLRQCVTPAAMDSWLLALKKYGTMTLAEILADPIDLCENGYVMYDLLATAVAGKAGKFREWPGAAKAFMKDGRPLGVGEVVYQKDLATTFRRLVAAYESGVLQGGREAGYQAARDLFYTGEIAKELAAFSEANGGLMTYDDIAGFGVRLEAPIRITYRDYELYGCGPWSQGPTLPIALNIMEGYDVKALGHNTTKYLHLVTEALKAAFSDRHHHIGDPDFYPVPIDRLLSKEHAAAWRDRIDPNRACPEMPAKSDVGTGNGREPRATKGGFTTLPPDTSYVAVVDAEGNVFSATPSDGFSVPIVPGLGFIISGRGSQSWLDPEAPASVQPGKRPRLTTNPFILFKDGKPIMPFGTPGADVQPQAMLQFVMNVVEFGMDPQEAAEAPRLSTYSFPLTSDPHPYNPNLLKVEERMGRDAIEGLAAKGHDVVTWPDWHPAAGSVCGIWIDRENGTLTAGADPRRVAYALGW
ncbi:MAG: gamma-glutamyltransferase family protein [Chloroflexota bacterium]